MKQDYVELDEAFLCVGIINFSLFLEEGLSPVFGQINMWSI